MALTIAALLLGAIGSAMVLASRAIPSADDPQRQSAAFAGVLHRMTEELSYAHRVLEREAHAVTFLVADRTGDGSPQRIRYSWSGEAGDPLMRQENDEQPIPVLEAVGELALTYHVAERHQEYRGAAEELDEQTLHERSSLINLGTSTVDHERWAGQYFRITLGPETFAWRVTRAAIRARVNSHGDDPPMMRLRAAELSGLPSAKVLDEDEISISSGLLGTFADNTVVFSDPALLRPGQIVGLTFEQDQSGGTTIDLRRRTLTWTSQPFLRTTDAGHSWSAQHSRILPHILRGHRIVEGAAQTALARRLRGVEIVLRPNHEHAPTLHAGAAPAETAPLLDRYFRLDFEHDPTTVDHGADGQADWQVVGGGSFDMDTLNDGVWTTKQRLRTTDGHAYNDQTRVMVRMRHTHGGSSHAAILALRLDWRDGQMSPLYAHLQRDEEGGQRLRVYNDVDRNSSALVCSVPNLTTDMVNVQLLISAAAQTVNVRVDGVDHGTFPFERASQDAAGAGVTIGSQQSTGHAQFEYVRIESGEGP